MTSLVSPKLKLNCLFISLIGRQVTLCKNASKSRSDFFVVGVFCCYCLVSIYGHPTKTSFLGKRGGIEKRKEGSFEGGSDENS
jgi:hypothetical protein